MTQQDRKGLGEQHPLVLNRLEESRHAAPFARSGSGSSCHAAASQALLRHLVFNNSGKPPMRWACPVFASAHRSLSS